MKILLFGPCGQVGWELQRSLAPLGELIAATRGGEPSGDLSDPVAIAKTIEMLRPGVIVNAAAYTAVDRAESDMDAARTVNALAPAAMAGAAARTGALFVHYSTDYVFDGSGMGPRSVAAPCAPLNVYGTTKHEGEQAIIGSGCKSLIFRTSWVYAARGKNFAKTILKAAIEKDTLRVVADQIGAPTGAELIADVTAHAVVRAMGSGAACGLYHLAAAGETSWHGYALFVCGVARELGVQVRAGDIAAVGSDAYPTPARRPLNSRLDCSTLEQTFDISLPCWQDGVRRVLREIIPTLT